MGLAEALGARVEAFIGGLAIGTEAFLDDVFRLTRDRFGPNRKDGARKIHGVDTKLHAMRDLAQGAT